MSAVATDIGFRPEASHLPFAPSTNIPHTDIQSAIDALFTMGGAALAVTWASMAALSFPLSANAIQTSGYRTAGDGGDALYKRVVSEPTHAGKVQSLDGAWWEIQLTNGRLNVKAFGAYGNNTDNDAVAITNAIAAAATLNYGSIWIPYGQYYTGTTTITLTANVAVYADDGALLRYDGTGTALLIESSLTLGGANMFYGRQYKLPAVFKGSNATPVWYSSVDTTSVGVRITGGMQNCEFWIPGIAFFCTGLLLDSSTVSANIVCNNFYLGRLINNKIGIHLLPQASWGVNQNQFLGGSIRVDGAYTTVDPSWKILSEGNESNNNTYIGVNLEMGAVTNLAISCASDSNDFINCRFEGGHATAGFITFLSGADNNHVRGGWGSFNTFNGPFDVFVSDAGAGNVYEYASVTAGKFFRIDWQSGRLQFGGGTVTPDVPVRGYSDNRLQIGDANSVGTRHFSGLHQEELVQATGTTLAGYANFYQLTHSSPTTITAAAGACVDQTLSFLVSIVATTGNITIQHDAAPAAGAGHFVNSSGANLVLTANRPVLYLQVNGNLYQI
jgi:hypothetical protein